MVLRQIAPFEIEPFAAKLVPHRGERQVGARGEIEVERDGDDLAGILVTAELGDLKTAFALIAERK